MKMLLALIAAVAIALPSFAAETTPPASVAKAATAPAPASAPAKKDAKKPATKPAAKKPAPTASAPK